MGDDASAVIGGSSRLVDAFLASPYGVAAALIAMGVILLLLMWAVVMILSKGKLLLASDGGSLAVITMLQGQINTLRSDFHAEQSRFQERINAERAECARLLHDQRVACDKEMAELRERLAKVEVQTRDTREEQLMTAQRMYAAAKSKS